MDFTVRFYLQGSRRILIASLFATAVIRHLSYSDFKREVDANLPFCSSGNSNNLSKRNQLRIGGGTRCGRFIGGGNDRIKAEATPPV